jgi:uncharacterized protein with HEPN domain
MRSNARIALGYAASHPGWIDDQLVVDAIAKRVEEVTEAAKYQFPFEQRWEVPDLEWDDIAGMRDRLVHDYGCVNLRVLQAVVDDDLPRLIRTIDRLLGVLRAIRGLTRIGSGT